MQISAVRPITVTFGMDREAMSFCFVAVETDDGRTGYGESCDSYGCSYAGVLATVIDDAFAPLLLGQEFDSVDRHIERLRAWTRRRLGDQWVATQAHSAVEIALWDLAGQAAGRSVSALLGRVRERVAVYASAGFLEEGDAAFHLEQLAPLLARGVRMVKVRVGPEWQRDLETMAKVRDRLDPSIELMVDGSEIFTLPTALRMADRLRDLGVAWFEEPLPQGERAGIEELARRSPVPIAYGEHLFGRDDAIDALRASRLSVLQPDASTCGGIQEARQMATLAAFHGARVVPHVCAGPISLAANLHLAASVPSIRAIEYPPSLLAAWDALGTGAPLGLDAIVDGELPIPTAPGLGVGLDESVAAAHPYHVPRRLAGIAGSAGDPRAGFPDRFVGDR